MLDDSFRTILGTNCQCDSYDDTLLMSSDKNVDKNVNFKMDDVVTTYIFIRAPQIVRFVFGYVFCTHPDDCKTENLWTVG